MKLNLFAGVLAASLAVPALANEGALDASVPEFTAADTQQLFEQDARPMQLAALSAQEMKETEGAWVNYAFGAAMGGMSYGITAAYTRSWSWLGFGTSVGVGALTGGRNTLTAVGAVWCFNRAVAFGTARGVYSVR